MAMTNIEGKWEAAEGKSPLMLPCLAVRTRMCSSPLVGLAEIFVTERSFLCSTAVFLLCLGMLLLERCMGCNTLQPSTVCNNAISVLTPRYWAG